MGDFIREVDEEYRRDRIMAIWKRYSGVIVGVIVLVVAGVGGWRYWQHMERQRAEAAAVRYEEAVRLAREGKSDEAEQRLAALAKEAPPGYQTLSRFRLAAEQGRQNADEGAKAYDALAADGGVEPVMQDLARLRAAMLRIDTADLGRGAAEPRAPGDADQCLAPYRTRAARPERLEARRLRRRRTLVRPDRRRPRHAAGPARAARALHLARRRRPGPDDDPIAIA